MKIEKQKVELIDFMGTDLSVVNAARVSFHKESELEYVRHEKEPDLTSKNVEERYGIRHEYRLSEKDAKLISYLAKHNHWSPFAHTSLQFRIKAPIFVARQMVKHQVGGVWNEVSRRYVDDEPEFYFPEVWRGRADNAKQGSDGVVDLGYSTSLPEDLVEDCLAAYNNLLNKGVAPEQARMILPQNTMTEWIWTGSLFFFARVCKLRLDAHAQAETQEIAKLIHGAIPKEFEHSWKALME